MTLMRPICATPGHRPLGCRPREVLGTAAEAPQPISVAIPPINGSQDVLSVISSVWDAIRDAELTPEEATALCLLIDRSIRAIEVNDLSKRLDELEAGLSRRDKRNVDKERLFLK
jgi:hypothetical protein